MNIDLIAKTKGYGDFMAAYRPGDELAEFKGRPLLFHALSNNDPESRYLISMFLLENGASALDVNEDGEGPLHIALSRTRHDLGQTCALCRELIARGADVNQVDRSGRVALQYLINLKYTEDELWPLCELWLSQPNLLVSHRNSWGVTPLELAERLPYRERFSAELRKIARKGFGTAVSEGETQPAKSVAQARPAPDRTFWHPTACGLRPTPASCAPL